jgi:hypothetical protein
VDLGEDGLHRLTVVLGRVPDRAERELEQPAADLSPAPLCRHGDVAQQRAATLPVALDERKPDERALVRVVEARAGDEAVLLGLPRFRAAPQPRRPIVGVLLLVRVQEVRLEELLMDRVEQLPVRARAQVEKVELTGRDALPSSLAPIVTDASERD